MIAEEGKEEKWERRSERRAKKNEGFEWSTICYKVDGIQNAIVEIEHNKVIPKQSK